MAFIDEIQLIHGSENNAHCAWSVCMMFLHCLLPGVGKYLIIYLPYVLALGTSLSSLWNKKFRQLAEMHPVVGIKTSLVLVSGTIIQYCREM